MRTREYSKLSSEHNNAIADYHTHFVGQRPGILLVKGNRVLEIRHSPCRRTRDGLGGCFGFSGHNASRPGGNFGNKGPKRFTGDLQRRRVLIVVTAIIWRSSHHVGRRRRSGWTVVHGGQRRIQSRGAAQHTDSFFALDGLALVRQQVWLLLLLCLSIRRDETTTMVWYGTIPYLILWRAEVSQTKGIHVCKMYV